MSVTKKPADKRDQTLANASSRADREMQHRLEDLSAAKLMRAGDGRGARKTRILVAEDRDILADLTHALLDDGQRTIDRARSGHEAYQALRKKRYDILIVDNKLGPGMTGLDLLEKRNDYDPKGRLYPLMVSGDYGSRDERTRLEKDARARGAKEFLSKDVAYLPGKDGIIPLKNAVEKAERELGLNRNTT